MDCVEVCPVDCLLMQLICTPVRSRSMTRLGCRTQARRVFRQGNGINPHFQHTPQYFSPICRCSGMCKTSLLDVDTVLMPLVGRACWGTDNVPPGVRRRNARRT